ncbi:MAG: hypothetical protein U5L11_09225 [Arhodomonas sp.]|nr:hypothetical protein [Arhodomonas sp.]
MRALSDAARPDGPSSTAEVARHWRAAVGDILGVESLRFDTDRGGPGGGAAVTVELSHADVDTLNQRGRTVARQRLERDQPCADVDDGYQPGKPQWSLRLTESGRALGLTAADLARQVRGRLLRRRSVPAASRCQRGNGAGASAARAERDSEAAVAESFLVRTPAGACVPWPRSRTIEQRHAR